MSRQQLMIIAAVVVILAGGMIFRYIHASATTTPPTNYPSQGTDIIAFGDSLVSGYGSTPGHDMVSDVSADIGQPIVNLGVSGDRTATALARLNQLDQYHPKVIILLLGGNDYLDRQPMDHGVCKPRQHHRRHAQARCGGVACRHPHQPICRQL